MRESKGVAYAVAGVSLGVFGLTFGLLGLALIYGPNTGPIPGIAVFISLMGGVVSFGAALSIRPPKVPKTQPPIR